ncbi:MAG: biotin--[acetyl-CoA-carboxylase] ligase [Deltaproteobacteria bacterium]|nr:biotin--[acetyl-CoA-carboxylase] ligase [Deltaproteobacteria bacterium]
MCRTEHGGHSSQNEVIQPRAPRAFPSGIKVKLVTCMNIKRNISLGGLNGIHIDTCTSTNSLLRDMLLEGLVTPPCFLWSDLQTCGKGRLNRSWIAPQGNINLSLAIAAPLKHPAVYQFNLLAGYALFETIQQAPALNVQIKWPNDVLINRLKVAGILSETVFEREAIVIGVGVNLNSQRGDFLPEIRDRLTTIRHETCTMTDAEPFVSDFLSRFNTVLKKYNKDGFSCVYSKIHACLAFKDEQVIFEEGPNRSLQATLMGIDPEGLLVLKTDDGLKKIIAGDIRTCF